MLHDLNQCMKGPPSCREARIDWARGVRGLLTWGIPTAILLATPLLPPRSLAVIWPVLLTFMGVACLANARRCGRIHCFVTGPFFLVLAALALLYGVGILPLGEHGWATLSAALVIGGCVFTCVPEWVLGRYRSLRDGIASR
jgi:hypothetical protein